MKRRIVYVSGTRADFGLLAATLRQAAADPRLDVSVCVTGMHLAEEFGLTVKEIETAGLPILAKIPVDLSGANGAATVLALGHTLVGLTEVLSTARPDLVLILGDRAEMLAGALAAIHLNIPVVHLHGGERSGTLDEPVRHAISKLAHYHCVATPGARQRLTRMGEHPNHVFVTGAPGLDGLTDLATRSRRAMCSEVGFEADRPVALVVFHPVAQESDLAGVQMDELLSAIRAADMQAFCLRPNSDAGYDRVRHTLARWQNDPDVRVVTHLARHVYVSWMAAADVMVGNSSSGIIEAASFGLPVVNVGSRQNGRERSGNVIDCPPHATAIRGAIDRALGIARANIRNVYGDGRAGPRIVDLLATLPLPRELLMKTNAY